MLAEQRQGFMKMGTGLALGPQISCKPLIWPDSQCVHRPAAVWDLLVQAPSPRYLVPGPETR